MLTATPLGNEVLDAIPAMAWSLQPDGTVDFLNRRWLEYTGLTLPEALANSNGVMHPDDAAPAIAAWRHSLQTGEAYELEMRLRAADGQYHWFLVRTTPLRNPEGNIVKWYGTSTDVDALHQESALGGPVNLSLRELLILKLVAEDLTSQEIADRLGLKRSTVDTYRSRMMEKLDVKGVAGLVRAAIRQGLVKP